MPNAAKQTLDEVFPSQRPLLIRMLARIVGNPATAEDLVHEAYLRVSAAAGERRLENVQAFLYQTARNLALDHLRAERRRSAVVAHGIGEAMLSRIPSDRPSPETDARDRQLLARIEATLAGLTPRQREVLVLAKLRGCTYGEIAERLGVSASTVQKDLTAAMTACVQTFSRLGGF